MTASRNNSIPLGEINLGWTKFTKKTDSDGCIALLLSNVVLVDAKLQILTGVPENPECSVVQT